MKALLCPAVPPTERLLNALALLLILGQIALIAGYYTQLPETIPVHFGAGGQPDRWGGRGNLLVVPGLSVFFFLLFWAFRQLPAESYNMPSPLTPQNRERRVRNTHEMLAMLLFSILIFMLWTLWYWLDAASNPDTVNHPMVPIVVLLLSIAGITVFYVQRAYRRA